MRNPDRPIELKRIACEVCLKEVPKSEAEVSEASEYVAYFCGLECYELWKNQPEPPDEQAQQPAPSTGKSTGRKT